MNYAFILENLEEKLKVTYDKHRRYKHTIDKILSELYPDRLSYDSFFYVKKQDFDIGEGDISIINKSIGNITILKWLYKTFNFKSFNELLNFVEKNKKELFLYDGKYFDEVLAILRNTENKGRENEKIAIEYLNKLMESKGHNVVIKQTSICSREDVIDGIDLILTNHNKDFFIQVKPLASFKLKDNFYEIKSSGKLKNYSKVHYFIFVNKNECLLFVNRGMKVINGDVFIHSKYLKL